MKRIAFNLVILTLTASGFAEAQAAPRARAVVVTTPHVAVSPVMFGETGGSYLGVDIDEITPERVKALNLKEERGVEITMVDQDAPAAKAGLKEHDVVVEFNGQRVEGSEQFVRYIHETPAGRTVTLGIIRGGQSMTLKATLGSRMEKIKKQYSYKMAPMPRVVVPQPPIPDVDVEIPAIDVMVPSTSTGIALDNLTPQLAQYFGVKQGQGVLVRNVEKGSPAEKAGMRAGDVIIRVDNEAIESRSDYRQAIRHRNADTLKIVVVRDKKEQTLTMNLPRPRHDRDEDDDSMLLPGEFDIDFENAWDSDSDSIENAMSHVHAAFEMAAPQFESGMQNLRDAMRHMVVKSDNDCQHDLK
jgi:serine protease Do